MRKRIEREMWWPERVRKAAVLLDARDGLVKLLAQLSTVERVNFGNIELQSVQGFPAAALSEMVLERLAKLERKLRRIGVEVGT